ncbi:MAG: hypothetical protein M3Q33_00830 [Acidobacteriota bacterium]|nr:hypothetical protein [Acidobacteriota bacterium]
MLKLKKYSKIIPLILIVSILFTACDVPDISKFTEQSAEMTRGIRKGVKDTGDILQLASQRKDLISNDTDRAQFKKYAQQYQTVMKPTLATLDSLDGYLEALNALSQANKKAGENSKAVVDSVGGLVTAVSGITLADSAVKIATGLLTLTEQFRTARSFKKKVNKAAEIVEGRFLKKVTYPMVEGKQRESVEYIKKCTDDKKALIETASVNLDTEIKNIEAEPIPSTAKIEKIEAAVKTTDDKVFDYGCGVIDLLKFTMQDLQKINKITLDLLVVNLKDNKKATTEFHDSIVENDTTTQRELTAILKYKNLLSIIKENEYNSIAADKILGNKRRVRKNLEQLFMMDASLETAILTELTKCDDSPKKEQCQYMKEFINFRCKFANEDEEIACNNNLDALNIKIGKDRFDVGNGYISVVLEARATQLYAENKMYLAEKERIKPDYTVATDEIKALEERQKQLHKLLGSSIDALEVWAKTHANLRVAVNTNKPLTVSALAAKVKEIWAIIEPEETN